MLAVRRCRIDAVECWRLDRLGRDLAHLLAVVNEWTALGVAFISLGEGIDATTPAGALQLHTLGALAQFARGRLRERVLAGLARAREGGAWAAASDAAS
jgi:DNA invertase Pin-like site-specific DNA recombinase